MVTEEKGNRKEASPMSSTTLPDVVVLLVMSPISPCSVNSSQAIQVWRIYCQVVSHGTHGARLYYGYIKRVGVQIPVYSTIFNVTFKLCLSPTNFSV